MLQAYRLQRGNPTLSYQDMKKNLGEPVSAVPRTRDAALSPSSWWLRSVVGTHADGVAAVEAAFPAVARGRVADEQRSVPDFTEFDGYVPAAGPFLDPSTEQNVYSVTELEKAAECPFRFFLKKGLGVRPVDERERDRDVWLGPLTRGSELHDVYAALLRRVRDEGRPPVPDEVVWLTEYAEQRLTRLNDEMPAPTQEALDRESRDFLADVALFVESEVEDCTRIPVGLEVSFGRPLQDAAEPLARPEPVVVSLGNAVTLRIAGRIDRINQVGTATFEVLDYKTGGFWRDKWKGTFDGGKRLQHALYGLAALELLKATHKKPTLKRGVYYFSSHKGRKEMVSIPAPSLAAIGDVLGDLRAVIVAGHFTRATSVNTCTFCDFSAACGKVTNQQAEAKLASPIAASFARLAAHA